MTPWKKLDLERGKRDIEWTWIRGHNGDPMNEYADRIANDEAARVCATRETVC